MNDTNTVTLIGRLGNDAALKYTNGGTAVCAFSIAVNRQRKVGDKVSDKWESRASWFDVALWGKFAEAMAKYLVKGKQVCVVGHLDQERWEKDGTKHSRVKVVCESLQLLGDGKAQPVSHNTDPEPAPATAGKEEEFEDDIPF